MNRSQLLQALERLTPPLANIAALALALVAGVFCAQLAWALVPAPTGVWSPAPVNAQQGATQSGPDYSLDTLAQAELFGRRKQEAESGPDREVIEDAPDTRLSLTLLGVYSADEESMSRAIIAANRGDAEIYAIGHTISRNVTLHAVLADRVILDREGNLETLRMERTEAAGGGDTPRRQMSDSGNLTAAAPQQLAEIRNELLDSPGSVTQYIRVVPASSGGQQQGYRIYPGRDRSLFEAAGMRPGDLVTAVNGVPLDNAQRAMSLVNELRDAQSIDVTVERGGNQQTYTLSIN